MSKEKKGFKETIAEIQAFIKAKFTDAAAEMQPADALKEYKTTSGVTVKIDKLEAGGKAYSADGVTLLDDSVTLEDGTEVTVGADGVITAVTVPGIEPVNTPPAPETPEAQMQAMAAKFASGTPEERLANLETMCMALMQYCFGWKIDEATRKAIEEQAVTAYKTLGLPAQFAEQVETLKAQFKEQSEGLKLQFKTQAENTSSAMGKMLGVMMEFAELPAEDPAQKPENKGEAPSKKARATDLVAAAQKIVTA
jgi:hypothetical protein